MDRGVRGCRKEGDIGGRGGKGKGRQMREGERKGEEGVSGQILRVRVDLTATRLKIQCFIIEHVLPRKYFPAQNAKESCSALLNRVHKCLL